MKLTEDKINQIIEALDKPETHLEIMCGSWYDSISKCPDGMYSFMEGAREYMRTKANLIKFLSMDDVLLLQLVTETRIKI